MNNDNNRYMLTGYNTIIKENMVWSNEGEGLTKQDILALYARLVKGEGMVSLIVSKIMPVVEITAYDFKND